MTTAIFHPYALLVCVYASRLEGVPTEWSAMQSLFRREVGTPHPTSRHATMRNPRSTAYGWGQFLNGTWRGTGIRKTTNVVDQARAMYRYIHARYGSAQRALEFHRKRRWY